MEIKYCLPIIKSDKEDVIKLIQENINDYEFFEVWLDYIENIDQGFLARLINLLQERLIILLRRKNLESGIMPLQKRHDIILSLTNSKTFLDLDISQKDELQYVERAGKNINLITSYHNYDETPNFKVLTNIIKLMEKYSPKVYKISTLCQNEDDAFRLMQLLLAIRGEKKKYIILGMGKFGTITRVYGTLWGNEMIFAPKNLEEQSAEGQLTKQDLEAIFKKLNT